MNILIEILHIYKIQQNYESIFVINIWNKYVLTCSGGVIMLLVCKCELYEIMR